MKIQNVRANNWRNAKTRWQTRSTACNRTSNNPRARWVRAGQQRTARQLNDAADVMARDRVADRIREGKQNLNGAQQGGGNRSDERAIERSLNAVSERLQAAEQSAGRFEWIQC